MWNGQHVQTPLEIATNEEKNEIATVCKRISEGGSSLTADELSKNLGVA